MPSLRDIRKRIGSVRSNRQITRAMKMVSAAKLRRAQDAIIKARPYAVLLERTLGEIAARAEPGTATANPLLTGRPAKNAEMVLVTSDRGLAGAFNANVLRRAQRFVTENAETFDRVEISTIGRKARDYLRAHRIEMRKDYAGVHKSLHFERAQEIAEELTARYLAGEVDVVFVCYNEFKSVIAQTVVVRQLLPIQTAPSAKGEASAIDFLYEPARQQLLEELLPRHLNMQVWRCLLESAASEHGARMAAMEAATRNAEEMIGKLTLQFNRARQAYITRELMEIVSGAEALK